jgi:hypothetical protein
MSSGLMAARLPVFCDGTDQDTEPTFAKPFAQLRLSRAAIK